MIVLAFRRASVENPLITVANGQEALEFLDARKKFNWRRVSDPPAVIILDLDMPQMDGFEFLRRVKADQRFAAIPIVVLTTSQFERDLTQSYALGASSCLTKPADFEQLVKIAAEVDQRWCRRNRTPKNG
jgi:CheY-like chemotaxis protein